MIWLNVRGGLGDTLITSSVLKCVFDTRREKYNVVMRTGQRDFFVNHPGVNIYGHPPDDAEVRTVIYSHHEAHWKNGQRPFQVLAEMFGLRTPVKEELYIPAQAISERSLLRTVPKDRPLVAICPSSSAPHKEMSKEKWESLVKLLNERNISVVQVGHHRAKYIRGAYDFRGLTSPGEAATILRNFHAVVTIDSFLMHAAYMWQIPTVVLWGPTDCHIFGYETQINLMSKKTRCTTCRTIVIDSSIDAHCISGAKGWIELGTHVQCPLGPEERCMDCFDVDEITNSVLKIVCRPVSRRLYGIAGQQVVKLHHPSP